jgi:hypothetical protein
MHCRCDFFRFWPLLTLLAASDRLRVGWAGRAARSTTAF